MRFNPLSYVTAARGCRGWRRLFARLATATMLIYTPAVFAVDWQAIKSLEVALFHPGQYSWEWLLTPADHPGASGIRQGNTCRSCHDGQQADMGATIAQRADPAVDPASASLTINVQTAWDKERFYLHASWPVRGTDKRPSLFTVMVDDGQVTEATRGGCWGACHDDLAGMPSAAANTARSKYLIASRTKVTRSGGGDTLKTASELDALRAQGKFLEYWQVAVGPAHGNAKVDDSSVIEGYVLEQRHTHPQSTVSAQTQQRDGRWIIELSRARTVDAPGRKALAPGDSYTLGFAIHEPGREGRFHYVSFGYNLKLAPGTADIVSKRLD